MAVKTNVKAGPTPIYMSINDTGVRRQVATRPYGDPKGRLHASGGSRPFLIPSPEKRGISRSVEEPIPSQFLKLDNALYSKPHEVFAMKTRSTAGPPKARRLLGMAFVPLVCLLVVAPPHTPAAPGPASEATPAALDTLDLSKIYGRIQIVEHFPDYKVKIVEHFPDLKVQVVEHFPNAAGNWQIVENFPDYKIQFVENFPDFTIKYVEHFPGVR